MPVNSYMHTEAEWETFRLRREERGQDFMEGRDISWVAQVTPVIAALTRPGQRIFDPFAGLGTTLLGAGIAGRESCGFELEAERFAMLRRRLEAHRGAMASFPQVWQKDALNDPFPDGVDVIVTNPPYYHAGKQDRPGNIYAVATYEDYLETMEGFIAKCARAIPPGGMVILFTENIRDAENALLPQAYDICGLLRKYLRVMDERLILYTKESTAPGPDLTTNRVHEYVFAGIKPEAAPDPPSRPG